MCYLVPVISKTKIFIEDSCDRGEYLCGFVSSSQIQITGIWKTDEDKLFFSDLRMTKRRSGVSEKGSIGAW